MALVFALAAAVTYGAADFVGGLVTKRAGAVRVVLLSQAFGPLLTIRLVPLLRGGVFSTEAIGWGALAGFAGGTGVLLLYRGLAVGRMSVVAPVTGVEAAGVPVIAGVVLGERPSLVALGGVFLALAAVALVSQSEKEAGGGRGRGLPEALGAGLAFGMFFICLDQAPDASGIWPLLSGRAASLTLVASAAVITRISPRPPRGTLREIAAAGALDVAANVFYLLGSRAGLLSLVDVVTSMYPAVTVALARVVLKERFLPIQRVGFALGVAAVILIGLG